MAELFRESSLERLSSPEQLDRRIVIVPRSFWITAVGGVFLIVAVVVWGIFGEIPLYEEAKGIYTKQMQQKRTVVCYMPLESGKKIDKGMEMMLYTEAADGKESVHVAGKVVSVDYYVTSEAQMLRSLGEESLVSYFRKQGPVVEIVCLLDENVSVKKGTLFTAKIVRGRKSPAEMLMGTGDV